jgi:hypothetical protein
MVTVIVSALVETLTKHMFKNYLDARDQIEIGNAPSWYMKPVDDQMCVFTHKSGGLDAIDIVKDKARLKMIKKIDKTIEIVIYDNTKNITNQKEREIVENFKHDKYLPTFVDKNLSYSRISYEDEIDTTFVQACIPKTTIIQYQTQRLKDIKKNVSKTKANNAFDELENAQQGKPLTNDPNDPFAELE